MLGTVDLHLSTAIDEIVGHALNKRHQVEHLGRLCRKIQPCKSKGRGDHPVHLLQILEDWPAYLVIADLLRP